MASRAASSPPVSPILVLLLGIAAVSTGALFVRLADAPALAVAAWRSGLAALLLLPFTATRARREWRAASPLERRVLLLAGVCLALHFATWIASLSFTTVASSLVLVDTTPIWVALAAPWLLHERPTRLQMAGIAAAFAGAVVLGAGDLRLEGDAILCDLLALAGAITATGYVLAGRRVRRRFSIGSYALLAYGTAAILLFAMAVAAGTPLFGFPPPTWGWLLALAVGPQILGHSSYNWALRWVSAPTVSVFLLGEPILGSVWAWLYLAEVPPPSTLVGGVLILAGIWMAARGERARG